MTEAQRRWLERNREWQVHRMGAAYSRIGLIDRDGRFQTIASTHGRNAIHVLPDEVLVGVPSRRPD